MTITAASTVEMVQEKFPEAVVEVVEFRGESTIVLSPEHLLKVCSYLQKQLQYTFLSSVTAVDWPERVPRFDVVYHLLSLEHRGQLRLKVRVGQSSEASTRAAKAIRAQASGAPTLREEQSGGTSGEANPSVPTVSGIWPGANWYEREVYDLFGLTFAGHPNMQRILMPNDWTTYPLRKDYPLSGFDLPEPHWGGQVPYAIDPGVGNQTLRTPDGRELNESRTKINAEQEPGTSRNS